MPRTIGLFAALLVVQLLAAAALYWHRQQAEQPAPHRPLLADGPAAVDRLLVSDGQQETVLQRAEQGWLLPEREDLPANGQLVEEALDAIGRVTTRWPVTTSQASHRRFEVADDDFQRHIKVFAGDGPAADFFLGTSPAFRQVHLRRAGEEDVYAVDLNVTSLPAGADAWLDNTLLAIGQPQRIEGPDYVLQHSSGDGWLLEDAPQEAAANLDRERAQQLVDALANLRVQSLAAEAPAVESAHTLRVTRGDEVFSYRFFSADNTYYVQRNDRDAIFTVSQYDYDRITGTTLERLAPEPGPPAETKL